MAFSRFNQFNRNKKIFFPKDKIYNCHYCGVEMNVGSIYRKSPNFMTIDHKIAKNDGGFNHIENLIPCCQRCNNLKGSEFSYLEFKELVKSLDDRESLYKEITEENKSNRIKRSILRENYLIFNLAILIFYFKKGEGI